jgi:ABC-type uncharacterized transport system permease subunit
MRRVIEACFWICLACAVAGAAVGISLVWGLATDCEVSEIRKTIAIVFVAAAVTLVVGRVSLGRGQTAERSAVADRASG